MNDHRLHLEITSKCAVKCHACPRTEYVGHYPVQDLPLAAIENLTGNTVPYHTIYLCGDHGDPIYHSQFHDVLRMLVPKCHTLVVATNGSHRGASWWQETAQILRPRDRVVFGIDGLEDTNHLYRKGASWTSATEGLKVLKSHGQCEVAWQWILFQHNEHQLPQARHLAKEWGVDQFLLIKSYRQHESGYEPVRTLEEAAKDFANG